MSKKPPFDPSDLLPKSYTPRSSRSSSSAPQSTSPRSPSTDNAQRSIPDRQRSSPDRQRSGASSSRAPPQSQPKFQRSRTNSVDHPVPELQRVPSLGPKQFKKEVQRYAKHYLPLANRGIDIGPLVRANAQAAADAAGLKHLSREVPPLTIPPSAIPEYKGLLPPEELDAITGASPPQPPKPSVPTQPKPQHPPRAAPSTQRARNHSTSAPSPSVMHPRAAPALSTAQARQPGRGSQLRQLRGNPAQAPMQGRGAPAARMRRPNPPNLYDLSTATGAHAAVLRTLEARRRALAEGANPPAWMGIQHPQWWTETLTGAHSGMPDIAGSASTPASLRRSYSSSPRTESSPARSPSSRTESSPARSPSSRTESSPARSSSSRTESSPARSSSSNARSSSTNSSAKGSKKPSRHGYPP